METKICTKCGVEKDLSHFYKDKRTKDGLQYRCKECQKLYYQSYETLPPADRKVCSKCKKDKPATEFYKTKRSKSGLSSWCIQCWREFDFSSKRLKYRREHARQFRIINKDKLKERDLYTLYKINPDDLNKLYKKQNNKCAICNRELDINVKVCIDHDHNKNIVRGLLCATCNGGLGMFKDDIKLLQKAITYLTLHS